MTIKEIMQLDSEFYMNTFGTRTPLAFSFGSGCTLTDTDGNTYTDFLAGIAVNCLGYGDKGLATAISRQAKSLIHCSNIFYGEEQALLAQKLGMLFDGRVFLCNSGAEANEGAFKLARKYFYAKGIDRYEIISAKNSFHGRTLATVAATGQEKYQKPYAPMPQGFINVPYNDLDSAIAAVTPHTAAIFLELIQGEGGVIPAKPEYIKAIVRLCQKEGILLIIDEIQTGVFRTGTMFAYEKYGIRPDIVTLAKGLGGGVPIGAVLSRREVASAFAPGDHGTTFGGNPLACAAANYVLSRVLSPNMKSNVDRSSAMLFDGLNALKEKHPEITDVRGSGLLIGIELSPNINGKAVVKLALKHGFIINCAGHNTIRLAPPLIVKDKEIKGFLTMFDLVLNSEDIYEFT